MTDPWIMYTVNSRLILGLWTVEVAVTSEFMAETNVVGAELIIDVEVSGIGVDKRAVQLMSQRQANFINSYKCTQHKDN